MPLTPGSSVPFLLLREPWSPTEAQRIAAALRAPRLVAEFRGGAERVRFEGERGAVEIFRNSRSFRWRAAPSGGVTVESRTPLAALHALVGPDAMALLSEELNLDRSRPQLRMTNMEAQEVVRRTEVVGPSGERTVRTSVRAYTASVAFLWDDTPIVGARLIATFGDASRVEALDLYWNQPVQPERTVQTLTHDQLDAALRCKGAGRDRWVGSPTISYHLGYPSKRQRVLPPLYRVDLRVEQHTARVFCTAFRASNLREAHPDWFDPYLGDVLVL